MSLPTRASLLIDESVDRFTVSQEPWARILNVSIAGHAIRIHVATESLWGLIYPALASQVATPPVSEPDIEIFALEGSDAIRLPWENGSEPQGDGTFGTQSEQVFATYSSEHSTLSLFDGSTNRGLFWAKSTLKLSEWEFGAPLKNILTWALLERGLHLVHAAGVGISDTGVMITGPSGAGKSTTTAVCVQAGFHTTGDDYCVVSAGKRPRIFSIYGLMKLVPGALGTPSLESSHIAGRRSDGKAHFDIGPLMTESLTITALVFTKVGAKTSEPVALPPREALLRLLPSTWLQTSLPQPELFNSLSRLAQSVNSFELVVGPDTERIPEIVRSLGR